MSKISELGPITGANTRTEDLFVIVNLVQGDDGTKNITRYELVEAIQYEVFTRINITGGTISGTIQTNNVMNNNTMNDNEFNDGTINDSTLFDVTIIGATANAMIITASEFNDSTGNNDVFTYSTIDNSQIINSTANNITMTASAITGSDFSDGTGNNNVFTNTTVENITIEGGTANNLTMTAITLDNVVMTDALISNSDIRDTDLDNVVITNSEYSNGTVYDTVVSNSTITNSNMINGTGSNIVFTDLTISNSAISTSDFSDGTGNNNIFTNTTVDQSLIQNSVIANTTFEGALNDVDITNARISSTTADGLGQVKSTIEDSIVSNSTIEDSDLVDFDMDLRKLWQPEMDEDSYFAIKNAKTGETEQITYRQYYDEISKSTENALKVYASVSGDDNNPGTILQPVRNLKRAADIALEKAGGKYDRNDINNAVHISVGPGVYFVDEPISLPDDCAMTAEAGQYATIIRKKPGWERTNGIQVGSGCYVQGFAYMNFEVDNFDYPEGGFAIAYRPGAKLRRSPYIRDSSQLSNFNRLDVEPPLQPFNSKGTIADLGLQLIMEPGHSAEALFAEGDEVEFSNGATGFVSWTDDINSDRELYVRNIKPWGSVKAGMTFMTQQGSTGTIQTVGIDDFPNRLVGRGGGCLLADRRVVDPDSLYIYVLCFGFTPRTQNGMGYVARDGAGVNGIGSLSIFVRTAFYALNGGQMTLNNSGTQFGDISMRAKGTTNVVQPSSTSANLIGNTDFAQAIVDNKDAIIEDMVSYLNANTANGGLGYQGYDSMKCRRDTGIIIDNVGFDVALDTNYWGRLNGITYQSPISYVVVGEQLTETAGAIEHLQGDINYAFRNADASVNTRVDRSLDETINILNNGVENQSTLIFADTGVEARTNARELIQDNRDLIIKGMVDWIDNNDEFFAYDSNKCRRDIQEYILPATKWDMVLDTNYNSVTAGNAYYFKQAKVSIENQRDETVGSFKYLRDITDTLIDGNTALGSTRLYDKFNQVIDILDNKGDKFTPTNASYDGTTGEFVITIANHGLTVGRYITLMDNSFKFTCEADGNTVVKIHPTKADPAYRALLPITAVTANTITVNVGDGGGYKGAHTFVSAEKSSVSVLGTSITFSDDASISEDKRNARKLLQANREYIQDYMMTWAENEWYFYDSDKCQRDTSEYILPAVKRDMITGSTYNAIQAGFAYRTGTGKFLIDNQLSETIGAFSHLRDEVMEDLTDPVAEKHATDSFNTLIDIMQNSGRKYTITDATYDPVTGVQVLTLGEHDFETGDEFLMETGAVTFSCVNTATSDTVEIAHPRTTDPWHKTPITITGITDTTITANVGGAGGYTGVHTFVRGLLNGVQKQEPLNNAFTPTDSSYDPVTGITTFDFGASHDFIIGDTIMIDPMSVTYSCDNGNGVEEATYPRLTDPAYNVALTITAVTANTITVNTGDGNGYTGAHTFVGSKPNAIKKASFYTGAFTPIDATYSANTGQLDVKIGQHSLPVGRWIKIKGEGITFTCDHDNNLTEHAYPRRTDPAFKQIVRITDVSDEWITVNVGNGGAGYQYSANTAHTFVSALPHAIDTNVSYFTDAAKITDWLTPTTATYDPVTGDMVATVPNHGLTTNDHVEMKPLGMTFSCDPGTGGGVANDSNPRIGEPNYGKPLAVTAVTTNTFTFNVGSAGTYTGAHTFVSAEAGAIMKVSSTTEGRNAADQLRANKVFLQNEIGAYMEANYFIYNKDKCMRDTGYILNAVARDIATGSNVNSIYVGQGYRIGTVGANNVINNQLTETVGAITWLKNKIATEVLTDATAIARSNAAFDDIIDIMQNGNASSDPIDFGVQATELDAYHARVALQTNKQFIQEEVIGWLATNYPGFVYAYDACKRDLGVFIDTVSYDIQHGGNAATVNNTRLYFENAMPVLADDEIVPTSEAYNFIANLVGQVIRGENVIELTSNTAQVLTAEAAYTPTGATYDPVTGIMEVTIGSHTFAEGDRLSIDPAGITFSCAFGGGGTDSHPNANDPNYKGTFIVTANTATTVTVNAGTAGTNTDAHTFVSATADAVRAANMPEAYTPTDVFYDHMTGRMTMTLGDRHRFAAGDWLIFDEGAITLSCKDVNGITFNLAHPRPTDPVWNTPVYIDEVTADTVTCNVGAAGVDKVHTFVSATTNGVRRSIKPAVANRAVQMFEDIGQTLRNNDGEMVAVTEAIFTLPATYGVALIADADKVWGNKAKYQTEIIDHITEAYNGLGYDVSKCPRDAGYIVDAVAEDMEYGGNAATAWAAAYYFENAINVLPLYQRAPTKAAFEHLANVVEAIIQETTVTPTTGNVTVQNTSGTAASASTALTAKNLVNVISSIADDNSPVNVPAVTNAPLMEPSRTFARKALQKNREFIQEEVINFIDEQFFTINEGKCARDVGFIVDAVKRDVQTGSDYNSKYNGKAYRVGNPLAEKVIEEQLAETIESLKYAQRDLEAQLTGTALSRTTAAFNNVYDAMTNDYTADGTNYEYGDSWYTLGSVSTEQGMQFNRTFLQEEAIAWITQEYPSLVYDQAKCRRDTGFIVDALTWDLMNGSNTATRNVAKLYFENGVQVGLPASQRAEAAAWYNQMATLVEAILLKQTVTPTSGNAENVSQSFGTVTVAVAQEAEDLVKIIARAVAENTLINMPDEVEPRGLTGAGAAGYIVDVAIFDTRKPIIQAGVVNYLKENFNYLQYDQDKCRRDTGFIIDGISHDIQYGGNSATVGNAGLYFANAVSILPMKQRDATKLAFEHMAEVVRRVVRNEEVDIKTGQEFTPTNVVYDGVAGTMVITLGAGHDLKVDDYILFAPGSIVLDCGASVEIAHPRVQDPAYQTPWRISARTATTITLSDLKANYAGAHTFVRASLNAISKVIGNTETQWKSYTPARRSIANEAKALATMIADISDDATPVNLPQMIQPKLDWVPARLVAEKELIENNTVELSKDMINYISKTYNGISYAKEKCRRDVGGLVDAISHDVQYTTNYATIRSSELYFVNGLSILPFDQRQQTADFYAEMGLLVQGIATANTATVPGMATPVAGGTAVEGEWAQDMITHIEEVIRRDTLDAMPALIEPDTSWVDNSLVWAADLIEENLDELADDVTTWINTNYDVLDYDKAKCYRDGNYLLDAISHDLNYGGNLASRWNADFYYWNNTARLPESQRLPTASAYKQLAEICRQVVLGDYPGQVIKGDVSTVEESKHAYELGLIFFNILFEDGPKRGLPPLEYPDFDYADVDTYSFARRILINRRKKLQYSVQGFIGKEYKFYDVNLTRRDAGNLLTSLKQDFEFVSNTINPSTQVLTTVEGSQQSIRTFAASLFDGNAMHVFPVFNPTSGKRGLNFIGTVQNTGDLPATDKINNAYIVSTTNYAAGNRYDGDIYYWDGTIWVNDGANNVDLLYSFYKAWERMNTYIKTNLSPNAATNTMLDGLFNDCLIATTLRPANLTFGALVESIAHQFNGASAGVNRTALPLNFRNLGAAISASASVIAEDGGRTRWSGADELNNQYFARGLRINGRTGRIEGRPFTSSVRKLARRASQSRASI